MGKRRFHIVTLIIVIALISIKADGQIDSLISDTLSFESALNRMVTNSYSLKQSREYTSQKDQELKASRGLYLPNISVGATYSLMSEDITLDLTPVRDAITPLYGALGNYGVFSGVPNPDPSTATQLPVLPDNVSTQIVRSQLLEGLNTINNANWNPVIQEKQFGVINGTFTQPIFTGGRILMANQAAHLELQEAKTKESYKYSEVYSELAERYFALVLAKQVTQVRKQVFKTMEEHMNDAQNLKEQGIIANADYLHARVYWSDADRQLKQAVRQESILNEALRNTIANDNSVQIFPTTRLFYTFQIEPVEYFLNLVTTDNYILKQIDEKKQLAQTAYKAELGNCYPQIVAMGTYKLADKDLSPYIPDYMVGVGVKMDLFQGTSKYHKMKAAMYQENQAESFYLKTEEDIKTAITKNYQELSMYIEQLKELESAEEFANEYFRVQEKAFSEGMSTTTDVADAQLQVAKIKTEKLVAAYNFDMSLMHLLFYAGNPDKFQEYQESSASVVIKFEE
jgi:outer membrane protein TolC